MKRWMTAALSAALLLSGCAGAAGTGAGVSGVPAPAETSAVASETVEIKETGTEADVTVKAKDEKETGTKAGDGENTKPETVPEPETEEARMAKERLKEAMSGHGEIKEPVTRFNAGAKEKPVAWWGTGMTAEEEREMIGKMHEGFLDAVVRESVKKGFSRSYDPSVTFEDKERVWVYTGNILNAVLQAAEQGAIPMEDARLYILSEVLYTDQLKDEAFEKIRAGLFRWIMENESGQVEDITRMKEREGRGAAVNAAAGAYAYDGLVAEAEVMAPGGALYSAAAPQMSMLAKGAVSDVTPAAYNTAEYAVIKENIFKDTALSPLSTFSANCSTAGYTKLKYDILRGSQIVKDEVKAEELINYFREDYGDAEEGTPFAVSALYTVCPWNEEHRLLRVGIGAKGSAPADGTNFVLVADVSGSMLSLNKLPLALDAYARMTDSMTEKDRVSLLYYADGNGILLEKVTCDRKEEILSGLAKTLLAAGGGTNGALGLETAYELALDSYIEGGVNRVILATDGDFNIGTTSTGEVAEIAREYGNRGVYLTILGYGFDNLKDGRMEEMAKKGRGTYHFIGDPADAERALVEEAGATLLPVADDVKIQIEFNPETVREYRLIGYENDLLEAEEFDDDAVQAGSVGQGSRVTALYEIVPGGGKENSRQLKYSGSQTVGSSDICTVSVRYKEAGSALTKEASRLIEKPVSGDAFTETPDAGTAAAIAAAELALALRDSREKGCASAEGAGRIAEAAAALSDDPAAAEFAELIRVLIAQSER